MVKVENPTPNAASSPHSSMPLARPRRHERSTWADNLRRVYSVDALVCDACGARRKLIAFLTAPESIHRILEHLGLPTRPPPIQPAPATLFELD